MSTTAIAFKIPSEPLWRVVLVTPKQPVPEKIGFAPAVISVASVHFWGLPLYGKPVSVYGNVFGNLFGSGAPEFVPCDADGNPFDYVRRIVSPEEPHTVEQLLLDMRETLAAEVARIEAANAVGARAKPKE